MTLKRRRYKTSKATSKDFETEWISNKPNFHPTQRFEKIVNINDAKQMNKLKLIEIPDEIPQTNFSVLYAVVDKQWKLMGYKCIDCGKPMKDPDVLQKHSLICKNDKEINKQEEEEILKLVGKKD